MNSRQPQTRSEDMILVNAMGNLAIPHPTPPEFVAIPTLVEQDVTWLQQQRLYFWLSCFNILNLS
jgi:hypothetical protein